MSSRATRRLFRGSWLLGGALTVLILTAAASPADACGRQSDCTLGERTYRIALPSVYDDDVHRAALIYIHGYRGTSAGVMENDGLTYIAEELGVAFVATQALGPEWNIPGIPSQDARSGIDELAYMDDLIEELVARFSIDRHRIGVAGFSSGAMFVWHLACHRGQRFSVFIPMSGTFWRPLPDHCPTPSVNLIHFHGDEDKVVPLKGRAIQDAYQGDVEKAIELLAEDGRFQPPEDDRLADADCAKRENLEGKTLELCIFSGGHELRASRIAAAWRAQLSFDPE